VLVRGGAPVHTALPPAGQEARTPTFAPEPISPRASTRFRLIRDAGAWVELETVASDVEQPHCHGPAAAFAGLTLRLFVAAVDLQPVTVRRVRLTFAGGAIDLEPGVPVARDGDRWRAYPDDNILSVVLPPDAVGTWYRPALTHGIAAKEKALSADARLVLGDGVAVTLDARHHQNQCEWAPGRDGTLAVYVQQSQPERERRLAIEAQTSCALYAATVADSALAAAQPPAGPDWPFLRPARTRFTARAGAPVRWPDGAPAGRLSGEVAIPDDASPDRQRPCFDRPLEERGVRPESTLRLCLAPGDLLESAAFLSDQQVAVVKPGTRRQVAVHIENRTARSTKEIEGIVRSAARRRFYALGDVVLIPPGEDPAISRASAAHHGLAQYVAEVRVEEALGGADGMTQRLVDAKLIRVDGTPEGRSVKTSQSQQIQSARPPAEETDALDEILDATLSALAASLREDH
jgi:hypothetical protein